MKRILILCLLTVGVPGMMAGCSKSEPPVQKKLLQEQPDVMAAKALQDEVTEVSDQAKNVVETAETLGAEKMEAVQTEVAEVVGDMKDQLQGMSSLADTLKTDSGAEVPPPAAELTDLAKEGVPVPEIPDQNVVESASQELQGLPGAGVDNLTTQLDSALTALDSQVGDATSEVSQTVSGGGAAVAEGGVAVTEQAASVTESDTTAAGQVAATMDEAVTAASADTILQ